MDILFSFSHNRKKKNTRRSKTVRQAVLEESGQTVANDSILEDICLEYNFTYLFHIHDSFGDGVCLIFYHPY